MWLTRQCRLIASCVRELRGLPTWRALGGSFGENRRKVDVVAELGLSHSVARWFLRLMVLVSVATPPTVAFLRWRQDCRHQEGAQVALALLDSPLEQLDGPGPANIDMALALLDRAYRSTSRPADRAQWQACWHLARAYRAMQRGDLSFAREQGDTAERLRPDDPRVGLLQGILALRRGDRAQADRRLAAVASSHVGAPLADVIDRARLLRVEIWLDTDQVHQALGAIEDLARLHPRAPAVHNLLGLARDAVGDREGATEAFRVGSQLDPRFAAPLVNLARIERASGDRARARTLLEQALGVAPNNAEAWVALSVVLTELREPGARAAVVRAAQYAPDDPTPWVAQGELDLADGQLDAAVRSFREALVRRSDDPTAETNLGNVLARQHHWPEASEMFERATQHAPNLGQAWNGLGAARLALGREPEAIGPLQQAAVLLPNDPHPLLNLARALESQLRWADAVRAYREVLSRAPGHPYALERLAHIVGSATTTTNRSPHASPRVAVHRGRLGRT